MISGELLIGSQTARGEEPAYKGVQAATGEAMQPDFTSASKAQVAKACELADAAFDSYRETSPEARAQFLEAIADNLVALGDEWIERAMAESALPRPRLEGERGRTVGQLRLFAAVVRAGRWQGIVFDTPLPDRQPLPRPDLRSRRIALGPVAVFGASNFPLAFSVAGGDTASALTVACMKACSPCLVEKALPPVKRSCNIPRFKLSASQAPVAEASPSLRSPLPVPYRSPSSPK
jgi:alpha-ketoglutaric semialdehyde dehydrogenase